MARKSDKNIPEEIKNGNEEVLKRLAKKYFPSSRRMMRMQGFKDAETPGLFSLHLAQTFLSLQKLKHTSGVEFESYFFVSMKSFLEKIKSERKNPADVQKENLPQPPEKIVAGCVSILDDASKKLLYDRIAAKKSFETIAAKSGYSNAIIAQHEFNRSLSQLGKIVKVRMNISAN